jgi:soluble lytic murein transglycosylase
MSPLLLAAALAAALAPATDLDLTPALTGQPAAAAGLLEAGRPDEALAALGTASRPEARLVRGLAQEAAGRPAEALAALDGLEAMLPDLADRIQVARGRVLLGLARPAEAAVVLAAVPAGSLSWPVAALLRARALAALGDPAAALEALSPLLAAPPAGPLAAQAAPALRLAATLRAGLPTPDLAGARQALVDCWAGRPGAPEAVACLTDLRSLPGEAGRAPPPQEQVRRAEGLTDLGRNGEAISLLDPVVETGPQAGPAEPAACRARAALGRALRRDRQNGRAIEVLRPVSERCTEAALRVRSRYLLATAVSAGGSRDEAILLYRRFAREEPGSPLADDALFAAAELAAKAGRPAEAREALEELVRDHPGGDRRDEARFRLAWHAWRAGDVDGAIGSLQRIEDDQREVDPYEHARAAYWRARLLSRRGEEGQVAARAIWSELVALAPADYYALLSRAQLAGEEGVLLPEPAPAEAPRAWPLDPGPLREDRHLRAGVVLLRTGFTRAAAEELRAVRLPGPETAQAVAAGAALDPVLCLASLLERAGDHHTAHQLLRGQARAALRRPPEGTLRRVWEVAYPRAHADLVRVYAPAAGVPPELLLALMREESALDPEAVSAAGAVGLTQLMLPTARDVARRLKVPAPDRAGLMEPATSIRIGSAYLGELLRRYGGSPALALAAYNAGENAVGRWRTAGQGLALDEFVEEIPYDETRGYVKRVLRSYASYRLLSGAAAARAGRPSAPTGG